MLDETKYLPGLKLREITLRRPLDSSADAGDKREIDVFARVITGEGGDNKPYLVFFQGGPGSEDPRPALWPNANPGWLPRALEEYQVVMLDQRGTGRSTPVSADTSVGALAGLDPKAQAEYLTHLRADEIVNDAEALRHYLGVERWTLLGQSFGGFTSVHYLSVHPEALEAAIITGGLTSVGHPIDDVYSTTWQIMMDKSERFYRWFPGDRDKVRRVVDFAREGKILLPNGDRLTPERWRTIGIRIGMQGGSQWLHDLLDHDPLSSAFRYDVAANLPFGGRNPIYAVLHESSYADGVATKWSADRTMPDAVKEDLTLFGGEHIPRTLFHEDSQMADLAHAADIVAEHEWNQLYFPEVLKTVDVPVAAIAYFQDAYVPLKFSLETAELLPNMRLWVTSEYEHNGLRQDTRVIDRLIDMVKGRKTQ